ncbi:odorant receptor 255 [Nasonia vitripennis]|uniref:Odorant receptor n=1 Tax=Nasonia vitripennis TaxID=7425 RepID=A0A7M6UW99_NASVI|nr:odorant receptor 255 [Nasonia vitripennis]
MEVELKKYKRYYRDIKLLLVVSGIWPNFYPILDRVVSIVAAISTLLLTMALLNFCAHHVANIMILTKSMGIAISFFSSFLKICIFLSHHDDLVYLNDYLTSSHTSDLSNPDDRSHLLEKFSSFSKFFYTLTIAVALTFVLNTIAPFFALKRGKYLHIYPVIFPFDYEPGGSVYWSLISLELTAGFFVWSVTSGVDSVFGLYALQMCGELRVLAKRFEELRATGDYRMRMRECMDRHHLLMRSRDILEKVFGFLAIWLAVTSALVQCSLVFQAKVEFKTLSPFKIGFFFFYILMKLVQAFTYAWYGNLIAEESALCLNAMYNAHWPGSGDVRFMNDVLIVLSQKPLIFKAKSCMSLHMDVFTKIMNTAVSYFFLLQTLDEGSVRHL